MLGAIKNAAGAAVGVVVAEKIGSAVAPMVPKVGGLPVTSIAMAAGGAYLGSRGGLLGKLGYGMAVGGILHLLGNYLPGTVDVNFEGDY